MVVSVELYNKALDKISDLGQQLCEMREALHNMAIWAEVEYVPVDSADDYERDMERAKAILKEKS